MTVAKREFAPQGSTEFNQEQSNSCNPNQGFTFGQKYSEHPHKSALEAQTVFSSLMMTA